MKSNSISSPCRSAWISEVVSPRDDTYSDTFHQWLMRGVSVKRTLPTTWSHMCSVSRVSRQSDAARSGQGCPEFVTGTYPPRSNRHVQLNAREGACRKRPNRADDVAMTEHAVVIAGGGPTGMMLAGELKLAGVDVVVVERRASQELDGSRAGGLHSRTIEVLDQRGIAERFLSAGQVMQTQGFALIPLDISD